MEFAAAAANIRLMMSEVQPQKASALLPIEIVRALIYVSAPP